MRKFNIIILITFLFVKQGFTYSGTTISGKITTTNDTPVYNAKICFVSNADTNRRFSSLSDSLGNYSITITGVKNRDDGVADFQLYQNYPNPFSEQTTIAYKIKQQTPVEVSIYNILGQRVKSFRQDFTGQNIGQVQWDGRDDLGKKVANGIYFYSVSAGDKQRVKKMLFIDDIITEGKTNQVFRKNANYYVEDTYQDTINVYKVYIENTDTTKPKIEPVKVENVNIQGDTVLNFKVKEAILKIPQWPMVHYDARGSGHQSIYPYLDGLEDTTIEVVWRRDNFTGRLGMVSIGPEGNVYVGIRLSDTILFCFSPEGKLLWSIRGLGAAARVTQIAVKDDSTVIISVGTQDYRFFTAAYTPQGKQIWSTEVGAVRSFPAISKEGIIYFTTYYGQLYAINSFNGDIMWVKYNVFGESSPAIARDGTIYYSYYYSNESALIALYPDGNEKWRYTDSAGCFVRHIVIDSEGNLYFYKYGEYGLYCLSSDGKLKWKGDGGGDIFGPLCPAIMPDGNIISTTRSSIHAYNPSGELLWELSNSSGLSFDSSPIVDMEGNIYLGYGGSGDSIQTHFYRINKSGKVDLIYKGSYIFNVWWLTISNKGILYYIGGRQIVAVK